MERARADARGFRHAKQADFEQLGYRWERWFGERLAHFERIDHDIPTAFRRLLDLGQVQILTSNATHCYMPLVLNDAMLAAQMACGTRVSEKHLGERPRGMWLPECAYRPTWDHWKPSVLYNDERVRPGLETFIAAAGVTHFFVETHLITDASVMGTIDKGQFKVSNDLLLQYDGSRGWREPLEPVGVVSAYRAPDVFAFARHPRVSEQVWSGVIGYPGDGDYLDFHRKHGEDGLRYHRVTDTTTSQTDKRVYEPSQIAGRVVEHAQHFVSVVRDTLREYRGRTGRHGCVVASFDAELFGHWWFEGPAFLHEVLQLLANDSEIRLCTAEDALAQRPVDKVMRLPEGSWGENGDHSVWINDKNRLYWEIEYRAEGQFLKRLHELPWKTDTETRAMLTRAARELLLLQASDWAFVIHSGGAVDYGTERMSLHAIRFNRMVQIADHVASGTPLTDVQKTEVAEVDAHDVIFNDIDLNWWM